MESLASLVLVVGAGASKEVGLPVGLQLRDIIVNALTFPNDHDIDDCPPHPVLEALETASENWVDSVGLGPYLAAATRIRNGLRQAPSIDTFIRAHQDDKLIASCAKIAIASSILQAELTSSIYMKSPANTEFASVETTWYHAFFSHFVSQYQVDELPEKLSRITIVCFNYDRCIEYYMHHALMNYYALDSHGAFHILAHLRIFHPYGFIGPIEAPNLVPFGSTPSPGKLWDISQNLKTFAEGTNEEHSDIVAIRMAIRSAAKIAFLGFAFNPQNLDLLYGLRREIDRASGQRLYGTAYGISKNNAAAISADLGGRSGSSLIDLDRDLTCAKFMSDYSQALSI